jgi:hypothetical protein
MPRIAVLCCVLFALHISRTGAAEFNMTKENDGITVKLDGKLFTRYLIKSGAKPVLWPIIGPTGKEMTRAYPLTDGTPEETKDHIHHRSFWFTHGNVNGVSFWDEGGKNGNTVHKEFLKVAGSMQGVPAVIVATNDWVGPDDKKICEDVRTLTFGREGESPYIDFDITVKASNGEVKFGDTKEGTFGVRVAETMKVIAKMGGQIVTSEGLTDDEAWGKPAAWVDYHGPVDTETVGIAILNHPTSFRYPTHWHVRTYGLFAANPFGLHDFKAAEDGSYTLGAGETMTLRYRVLLHKGDEKEGKIAEAFAAYAKVEKK